MKQIKAYVSKEIYYAYKSYCQDQGASFSGMTKKIIMNELSRRGRTRKLEDAVWVQLPKTRKDDSL